MATNNPFGPKGWTPERLGSLSGKTFLITGANSGAGFQATRILLSKGGSVVMLNRNPSKSEAAIAKLQTEFGDELRKRIVVLRDQREQTFFTNIQITGQFGPPI